MNLAQLIDLDRVSDPRESDRPAPSLASLLSLGLATVRVHAAEQEPRRLRDRIGAVLREHRKPMAALEIAAALRLEVSVDRVHETLRRMVDLRIVVVEPNTAPRKVRLRRSRG